MKKSIKRTLSLLLALTMVLSLGLPAYAIGVPEDGGLISDEPIDRFGGVGRISDLVDDDELVIVDEPFEPVGEPIDEDLEIVASPEQSFNFAEEATGFSVEVSAPAGALPLGTEMVVDRLVDLSAVQAAVDAAENLDGEVQLAADISFWHEGQEIEPAEGTKLLVRMSAPEIEGIANPVVVHIPDGENAVPEIVEQMKADDDVVMVNTIEFEADSFSTFAIIGEGSRRVTVHYGYMLNGVFRHFADDGITSSSTNFPTNGYSYSNYSSSSRYAYLNYDFEGYTYKETRWSSATGTQIWPMLLMNSDYYWLPSYSSSSLSYTDPDYLSWTEVSNNANNNIYVIYEKKTITDGASSGTEPGGDTTPPEVPNLPVGKKVQDNHDGTFDITLSVTGVEATQEKVTKASVIVIFDVSGSMRSNMAGTTSYGSSSSTAANIDERARLSIAAKAVNALADKLLVKEDSHGNKLVQMALIPFSSDASAHSFGGTNPYYTSDLSAYKNAVNNLKADGATNWEAALNVANALNVSSEAPTYVVFVSDGDPTYRVSRMNDADSFITSTTQLADTTTGGTVFYLGMIGSNGYFGTGTRYQQAHYDAAVKVARSVVTHDKSFYTIGLSSQGARMENLATDAYSTSGGIPAGETHYFPGNSQTELTNAFNKIADAVENGLGFTNVSVDDGVTDLTTVESSPLTGAPENFVYRKGTSTTPSENPVWTGDDVPEAEIADDNHVIWNIASIGKLVPGTTYSVTFTVWPSQESYDIIADINNGIIRDENGNIVRKGTPAEAYAAQPEIVRKQIGIVDGVYTLLTNTGLNVSYTFNGVNGSQDKSDVMDNGSMPLASNSFGMKKDWTNVLPQDTRTANVLGKKDEDGKTYLVNSEGEWILDGEDKIELDWNNFNNWKEKCTYYVDLIVTKGNSDYTEVRLFSDTDPAWTYPEMFVAPGVLTTNTDGSLTVRETGDDYTVREKEEESYYWELHAETYHPMVINGEACMLQLVTENAPELAENTFSGDYYNINGEIFKKLGSASDAKIEAVNERRSYLDLTKVVDGAEGKDGYSADDLFTYTLKLENPNGKYKNVDSSYNPQYDDFWFSAYDPVAKATVTEGFEVTGGDVAAEMKDGEPTGYWHFSNKKDGQEITIKIKAGWNIRFINLVSGTTYEFVETAMNDGYSFKEIEATAEKSGSAVDYEPTITEADKKIVGTIDQPNTDYTVTYTNEFKGCFYVYHSADNTVEKIFLTDARIVDGKFNIAHETKNQFIYGGYYEDGGYSDAAVVISGDNAVSFEKKGDDYKTKLAYVTEERTGGIWGTAVGGKAYMGDGTKWTADKAYTDNGMAMTPVANTVYYLKEVPEAYLRGMIRYTYYDDPGNKYPIGTLWLVCALDGEYSEFGVSRLNATTNKTVTGEITDTFTVTPLSRPNNYQDYTAADFLSKYNETHEDKPDYTEGKVGFIKVYDKRAIDPYTEDCLKITEGEQLCLYWITPDGVTVTGTRQFSVTNIVKGSGVKIDGEPYITLTKTDVASKLTEPAATGSGT